MGFKLTTDRLQVRHTTHRKI